VCVCVCVCVRSGGQGKSSLQAFWALEALLTTWTQARQWIFCYMVGYGAAHSSSVFRTHRHPWQTKVQQSCASVDLPLCLPVPGMNTTPISPLLPCQWVVGVRGGGRLSRNSFLVSMPHPFPHTHISAPPLLSCLLAPMVL
jgi:hypothetical protein